MVTTKTYKNGQFYNKFANFPPKKPDTREEEKEFRTSDGNKISSKMARLLHLRPIKTNKLPQTPFGFFKFCLFLINLICYNNFGAKLDKFSILFAIFSNLSKSYMLSQKASPNTKTILHSVFWYIQWPKFYGFSVSPEKLFRFALELLSYNQQNQGFTTDNILVSSLEFLYVRIVRGGLHYCIFNVTVLFVFP